MQSELITISKTEKEVEVSLSEEEFLPHLDKAAKELSQDFEAKGFRKGNIPRDIVEGRVGSSALYSKAADLAVRESVERAMASAQNSNEDKELTIGEKPYMVPEIRVTKLAPNNPFTYKVILRFPLFDLTNDYKKIAKDTREKNAREIKIEDKEIDDTLKWLFNQRKGKKAKEASLDRKEGDAPGANDNEPAINDEFAKSLGNFQNLEELKKSIRQGISLEKQKREKERVRIAIANAIIEKSESDIPKEVVDREISKIEEEFKQSISQMGLDFKEYLLKIKKSEDELRAGWRDQARERVGVGLALNAIAGREGIKAQDKEVEDESQKALGRFKNEKEAEKKIDPTLLKHHVRGIIKNEKVFEFLESL